MLKSILIAIYVVLILIISIPYLLIAKLLKVLSFEKGYKILVEKFIMFLGKSVLILAGVRVEVQGLEHIPNRNVLYVSNHQSIVDIPVMLGYIPGIKSFIAKKETAKLPIINWWMKEINCVFLDRKNIRQGMKDMAKAREFLQTGTSMVIYPEGTRSKGDKMGDFKKGSLKVAVQSSVPVVPVAISGSYMALEKDNVVKKAKIKVLIGKPINTKDLLPEQQKEISEIAHGRVKKLLEKIQTP